MEFIFLLIVMAIVFGICFLVDKGFTRLFRSRQQHKSGLSVRPAKRYGIFGLLITVVAVLAVITGIGKSVFLVIGGVIVLLIGLFMIFYYLGSGVFYDEESFLFASLGKKTREYRFSDIREQRLYTVTGGGMIVELHLEDGKAVSIQSAMEGACPFLDHAFAAWCRQTGRDPKSCAFHDPASWRWFPDEEDM